MYQQQNYYLFVVILKHHKVKTGGCVPDCDSCDLWHNHCVTHLQSQLPWCLNKTISTPSYCNNEAKWNLDSDLNDSDESCWVFASGHVNSDLSVSKSQWSSSVFLHSATVYWGQPWVLCGHVMCGVRQGNIVRVCVATWQAKRIKPSGQVNVVVHQKFND